MTGVFLRMVNMSITAGYLILAVLVLRLILRKVSKNLLIWLWGLVGLRLMLPVSLESALSLIPKGDPIPQDISVVSAPAIDTGVPFIDRAVNPVIAENLTPAVTASVNPMQVLLGVLCIVWLAGAAAMLLYAAVSYLRLARRVRVSLRLEGNLYLCDGISTPFILGIVRPGIYLPSDMDQAQQSYVLKHEHAHLRHHDNWWKPLGFVLLAVYWFHPLVWAAYLLFCRDLEMACDERAVQDLDDAGKKAYSYALLSCAASGQSFAACPVAFGENSVKSRIKNVLHFKKASLWVAAAVLAITTVAAVCFLTNPKEEKRPEPQPVLEETAPLVQTTAPEETAYTPLDGFYTYTSGNLKLEISQVFGVKTEWVRDKNGVKFEQTTLLTEPGAVVTLVETDAQNGEENWRLCEETGTLGAIPLTEELTSRNIALGYNNYYLEDVRSGSHRVLLLKRKVESLAFYEPATAQDALVYDRNTGKLLYSYQHFMRAAPGDLNKLALALVVLEGHDPAELVDTTALPGYLNDGRSYRSAVPSAVQGRSLEDMKEMTVEDLLTLMLIGGCDDAAYVLARFDAGSEEAMVEKMNHYAKYACMDTHYTDLYGYAGGQYTTGYDTLFLVNRMLENPCLARIWQQTGYTLRFPDGGEEYTVHTTNYMLDNCTLWQFYDLRVTGGFALYRGTANMVCTAMQDGKEVVCIVLGAERKFAENGWMVEYYGNFEETAELLNHIFAA